jgi:hypothetical protein
MRFQVSQGDLIGFFEFLCECLKKGYGQGKHDDLDTKDHINRFNKMILGYKGIPGGGYCKRDQGIYLPAGGLDYPRINN